VNIEEYRNKLVGHINKINKSYFPEKKIYVVRRNVFVKLKM